MNRSYPAIKFPAFNFEIRVLDFGLLPGLVPSHGMREDRISDLVRRISTRGPEP
jgi:hypothetical protein